MKFRYQDYKPIELWEKFGCYSVDFLPFENQGLDAYRKDMGLNEEEYQQRIKEYFYSTVYDGIRYYFKTPEKLKAFCEMVENND